MIWLTCDEIGCKARVSPKSGHKRCQRHRPTPPQKRKPLSEEQKEARRMRELRRAYGVMPGCEGLE